MRVTKQSLLRIVTLIVLASFAVYFNALFNEFVYDDAGQILQNPWIRDIRYLPTVFTSEVWGFQGAGISNYYRPLMHVVYMIAFHIFGLSPWGFHALNILFHAGVSVLVFLLLSRVLAASGAVAQLLPAVFATLLFITHPIHTEAVVPVMCVTELSLTFFCMLSLYLHIRCNEKELKICFLPAAAFFLATLCKETALVLPVILFAYDYSFDMARRSFADWGKRYLPYLFAILFYFALRLNAIGTFVPLNSHPDLSLYQCAINIFPLVAQYMGKLILPINLNAKYEFSPYRSLFEPGMILSFLVALVLGYAMYLSARRAKAVFFGLVLLLVPLLPTLYIRAIPYPFAERYLYFPSIGFVLIIAVGISRLLARQGRSLALMVALPTVLGLYSVATIRRNAVWKDNYSLWSDTATKSPGDAIVHNNLATALKSRGRVGEAIEQYRIAVNLKPDAEIYRNLGSAYADAGLKSKAIEQFRLSLKLQPDNASTYNSLGAVFAETGMTDQAIEQFQTAVVLAPGNADGQYNLGLAYRDKGILDKALEHITIAVRLKPEDNGFRRSQAETYEMKGLQQKTEGKVKDQ